jgi:hypothetical protein
MGDQITHHFVESLQNHRAKTHTPASPSRRFIDKRVLLVEG